MIEQFGILPIIIIWLTITTAYIIFGITGFGTALVASPILAFFIPINKIVPLLALLDCFAAITNVLRDRLQADKAELKRLIPLMIIGSLVGASILFYTRPDILIPILGVFVICYALYNLVGIKPQSTYSAKAVVPFGIIGGIFSALFGSGGFIYAIYLSGRIKDKNTIRVTQSTLIGLSTFTRIIIFLIAGIYLDTYFIGVVLLLIPSMLLGVFIGRHITLKLSKEQFLIIINIVILLSGLSLLINYLIKI